MSWKWLFRLIFYAYQWRLRRQGKMVKQAVIPGNFKRRYRRSPILAYCFTDSLFSRVYSSIDRSSLSSKLFTVVSFNFGPIFFSDGNYHSGTIKYNCNWCRHQTLHLRKKTFPVFENLFKTSGAPRKVLSFLKIPLISMHIDHIASFENITTRSQTP